MIAVLNHQDQQVAERIQEIQQAAYRIEAELMDFWGIPQLHETVREIQTSRELFLGYSEERLQGVLSYKVEKGMIGIHRLVVDPANFRKGIGRKLLSEMLKKYRGYDFKVSTGSANQPAITLYKLFGFQEIGVNQVAPGIYCTQLFLTN